MAGNQKGVSYLALLFMLAISSLALAGTGLLWQTETRREREKTLLFVGEAYRAAIASYYDNSPGVPAYPVRLEDLLLDPRFPMPVRHLRQSYPDPMTADGRWELIRGQGGIIGVASSSTARPLKVDGFPTLQADFKGAARYAEWRFIHKPGDSRRVLGATLDPPR